MLIAIMYIQHWTTNDVTYIVITIISLPISSSIRSYGCPSPTACHYSWWKGYDMYELQRIS